MKKLLLVLLFFTFGLQYSFSQLPTPDSLVISELYIGDNPETAFAEITNMGKTPVDLSKYFIMSGTNGGKLGASAANSYYQLNGTLDPGKSYLIIGYGNRPDLSTADPNDSFSRTPSYYFEKADLVLPNYYANINGSAALRCYGGDDAIGIGFDRDNDGLWSEALGDTVVDQFGSTDIRLLPDIAGVTQAPLSNVLIRKFSIKEGNGGDFESGRGVSAEDSDWIVIPFVPINTSDFFTTIGKHGNDDAWSVTSSSVTVGANELTVPWGIRRDSLYQEFTFADNMAWFMKWGPDTLYSVVAQTKDTLLVYQAGDTVTIKKYSVSVNAPANDMSLAFPAYDRIDNPLSTNFGDLFLRYDVSDDFDPDTIFDVPFGTRIDTMYSYLEIASNASWAIDLVDDVDRPDLKYGDKLIVTAADNSTREYFIAVDEYEPSDNATLGAIYIYGDTLFGFKSNQYNYTEMLTPGSSFPTLSATPNSLNASLVIDKPANVKGNVDDRTATITVTAEDDSTQIVYKVTFEFMRSIESFNTDPIISQVMYGVHPQLDRTDVNAMGKGFEIFNPGNTVLPLGDYILGNYIASDIAAIVSSTHAITYKMRPGFKMDSTRMGAGVYFNEVSYPFITDLDPGKTVVFARGYGSTLNTGSWYQFVDYVDTNDKPMDAYLRYGFVDGAAIARFFDNQSIYIIRIDNDSIFNGTKAAGDADDYTLVDIWGAQGVSNNRTIEGTTYSSASGFTFERKPDVWKGNPENHGSFGTGDAGSSEWEVRNGGWYIGTHPYNPYAGYISTVTSVVYNVSLNHGMNETIGLVPPSTTVDDFITNIIPDGTDVDMNVSNSDSTVFKTGTETIVSGDRLNVVSGTGVNSTVYTITVQEPRHDATLTSTTYTVNVTGSTGVVSQIPAMTTVQDLISNLVVPGGAVLNIYDVKNQQVGEETVLFDTLVVVKTMVTDSVMLEVIAEDGITKVVYTLSLDVQDPYLTSGFYFIIQDIHLIDMFQSNTTVKTFLSRVIASSGSSITIIDKYGNIRGTESIMYIDDQVIVSDGSKTTVYTLKDMFEEFATDATLSDLTVDGNTVAGFDPGTVSYAVTLDQSGGVPTIPTVEAEANHINGQVSIVQASNLEGTEAEKTATVTVKAQDGVTTEVYTVVFNLNVGTISKDENLISIYSSENSIFIKTNSISSSDEVKVYNITGKLILQKKLNSTYERINIQEPNGLYIVKLKSEGNVFIEKVFLK